ncbi:hypothetical protein NQ176_g3453 [Zarea fungicola]|uniref:Uncharacterized protein n=1 Tax=Zarea fungicola TaxID=93591 RepID=A0ACC1NIF1_9HYPO|nr:hypothetical protein NQ176_g3453 [Lecanicillium fungicola]
MRISKIFQATLPFLAVAPSEAAFATYSGSDLVVVIGTKFSQQALNALYDAGVRNIPIDLAGAVHDDLNRIFGAGIFGAGYLISTRYTERALSAGAQGFFSIKWGYASPGDAARAFNQITNYVRTRYKREEDSQTAGDDFFSATGFTVLDDYDSLVSPSLFVNNSVSEVDLTNLGKRQSNTVCFNPSGSSYTNGIFNGVNSDGSTNFDQCESCLGGTRNGC